MPNVSHRWLFLVALLALVACKKRVEAGRIAGKYCPWGDVLHPVCDPL